MSAGPATTTDRLALARVTTVRAYDDYEVVETPQRRNFWYGNALNLYAPPSPGAHHAWLARHAEIFAGTGVQAHVVAWESAQAVASAPATDESYEVADSRVLELDALMTPHARAACDVRPLATDDDWAAAFAIDTANRSAAFAGEDDYFRWRAGVARAEVDADRALAVGAFVGDELLAFAGLHASDAWLRMTTPHTAERARGRGLFTRLFGDLYAVGRARYPRARCIVVAELGSAPERLYRSLGFVPIGMQSSLVRHVPKSAP